MRAEAGGLLPASYYLTWTKPDLAALIVAHEFGEA